MRLTTNCTRANCLESVGNNKQSAVGSEGSPLLCGAQAFFSWHLNSLHNMCVIKLALANMATWQSWDGCISLSLSSAGQCPYLNLY